LALAKFGARAGILFDRRGSFGRAGGTTFSFAFKPRFRMSAQSSESVLYDYYNTLARASVSPTRSTAR